MNYEAEIEELRVQIMKKLTPVKLFHNLEEETNRHIVAYLEFKKSPLYRYLVERGQITG